MIAVPRALRSTSFRLAAIYAAMFLASTLVILGAIYFAADNAVQEALQESVDAELDALRASAKAPGADLAALIEARAVHGAGDRFYLLLDADGRTLAGNLRPAVYRGGWTRQAFEDAGDAVTGKDDLDELEGDELVLAGEGVTLDGVRLYVGRNARAIEEIGEAVTVVLIASAVMALVLAPVGGWALGVGPARQVEAMSGAMERIVGGRLDERLPISGRGDEYDRLAGDVNAMLVRIGVLMDSLRNVSTAIAHDLRTPLGRLRQGLEGARERASAIEEYEAATEQAIAETETIIDTFNALLRIAQIEAGARKARFAPLDAGALIDIVGEVFEDVAADAGHRLVTSAEPGLALTGDRDLLQQMIVNLVENAITHVPAPGRIEVRGREEKGAVVIEVADDGPGVPEAERGRIFERLYRLDRSRTTPGSGLGLALVAAIAELHEGTVEALDAKPGLLVRVTLPGGPG